LKDNPLSLSAVNYHYHCRQLSDTKLFMIPTSQLILPYFTFIVGRLLHLPSAEAVSLQPNAHPRM